MEHIYQEVSIPQYSVLMATYHKENPNFLAQSLDSVFAQTLPPTEVVLVEDGLLTSELEQVVQRYEHRYLQIKVIRQAENRGLGHALNIGLQACSYDLVARMDTDDICYPHRFEKQIGFMALHPQIAVLGAWIEEFEGDVANKLATRKVPETHKDIVAFSKKRNPMNHPTVVFRKQAVIEAGSYRHFFLFEDYFLWMRMLQQGCQFHNLQEPLLYFRTSADMYKRRGGVKYLLSDMRFQHEMYRLHFIGLIEMLRNVAVRVVFRLIPNRLRAVLYLRFLR